MGGWDFYKTLLWLLGRRLSLNPETHCAMRGTREPLEEEAAKPQGGL